jgi:hypothetical protein
VDPAADVGGGVSGNETREQVISSFSFFLFFFPLLWDGRVDGVVSMVSIIWRSLALGIVLDAFFLFIAAALR